MTKWTSMYIFNFTRVCLILFYLAGILRIIHCRAAPSLWGWHTNKSNFIYDPGTPGFRNYTTSVYSTCGNNGQTLSPDLGYACPHMMMYSSDMLMAAKLDDLDDFFVYATCGANGDTDCGRCYQVEPLDAEVIWDPSLAKKQIIVQVVNSGFDVDIGHFDLYMAAGGFGWFTSCNSDCKTNYCGGGPCADSMYDSNFTAWNPSSKTLSVESLCYGGGVRLLNSTSLKQTCLDLVDNNISEYKNQVLYQSCFETNRRFYHQNFWSANSVPIQCPESLVKLTGLQRADEEGLPLAHINNTFTLHCRGSNASHSYCLTTMNDCCMSSCAWDNKGAPDSKWNRVDSCKKDGLLWNYS
jgi:hypothetical protein